MSFSSPTPFPRGLAWDGQYLWIADPETQRIIKVDTQGRILNKYNSPGTSPSGLAWDGQHLWVADLVTYKIYELQVP
jgi:DNA-binding beta-propeller fold protein YncE